MTDTASAIPPKTPAARPAWNEGALWSGASLPALWGMARRNGWRVAPRFVLDLAIDMACGTMHSVLAGIEALAWSHAIHRVQLDPAPIFILGHWRTGTTMLHELLALDPRHNAPNTFECLLPNHFVLTERWLKPLTRSLLPKSRGFDGMPVDWDYPQEDEMALACLGERSPYSQIAFPNEPRRDAEYLDLEELSEAQRKRWENTLLRFLRRLSLMRAGKLVIKSPTHTCRIPTLLKLFPQAKFIYVVRDPQAVYPSTLKLWHTLFATHGYQQPTFAGLEEQVLDTFVHFHERYEDTKSLIPGGNLTLVRYEELAADPVRNLERLYVELGLGDFNPAAAAVRQYREKRRDYRPNQHAIDETQRQLVHERWRSYAEWHGYGEA